MHPRLQSLREPGCRGAGETKKVSRLFNTLLPPLPQAQLKRAAIPSESSYLLQKFELSGWGKFLCFKKSVPHFVCSGVIAVCYETREAYGHGADEVKRVAVVDPDIGVRRPDQRLVDPAVPGNRRRGRRGRTIHGVGIFFERFNFPGGEVGIFFKGFNFPGREIGIFFKSFNFLEEITGMFLDQTFICRVLRDHRSRLVLTNGGQASPSFAPLCPSWAPVACQQNQATPHSADVLRLRQQYRVLRSASHLSTVYPCMQGKIGRARRAFTVPRTLCSW